MIERKKPSHNRRETAAFGSAQASPRDMHDYNKSIDSEVRLPEIRNTVSNEENIVKNPLSPGKLVGLAKTPSVAFEPNQQFLKSNPTAMPQLTPFEKPQQPVAKTPNKGLSSAKI